MTLKEYKTIRINVVILVKYSSCKRCQQADTDTVEQQDLLVVADLSRVVDQFIKHFQ